MTLDPRPSNREIIRIAIDRCRVCRALGRPCASHESFAYKNPKPSFNPYAPYKNSWELGYARLCDLELKVGIILSWAYEPRRFVIGVDRTYRPDFRKVIAATRRVRYVEVKGYKRRDAMTRLAVAAKLYPHLEWEIATLSRGQWVHTPVTTRAA